MKNVSELLDGNELILKTADNSDLSFLGFEEQEFHLSNWKETQMIKVPFLVPETHADNIITGYNIIEKTLLNPNKYEMNKSDILSSIPDFMPNVSHCNALRN